MKYQPTMEQNLMNMLQARMMMSGPDASGKDNTVRNMLFLELFKWMKVWIPKSVPFVFDRYIKTYVTEKTSTIMNTEPKSKLLLIKNYVDKESTNEHNKVDGVIHAVQCTQKC